MSKIILVLRVVLRGILKVLFWSTLSILGAIAGLVACAVGIIAWVLERFGILWVLTFFFQVLAWPVARWSLRKYGKLEIRGLENVKGIMGAAIFAANHESELDPFLVPAALNPWSQFFPMFYVSRERAFYEKRGLSQFIYGGLVFRIFGAYPAIVGIKDFELKLKNFIKILRKGRSVCIFPEGEIKPRPGLVKREHPGVAYLLWSTGKPIVPVALCGHEEMSKDDFFAAKRKIGVFFGEPITREAMFGSDLGIETPSQDKLVEVTKFVMARIRELRVLHGAQEELILQGAPVVPDEV